MPTHAENTLKNYTNLIRSFVAKQISAAEFETNFLEYHRAKGMPSDEALFSVLDKLFGAVDAYWHECTPETETAFQISEATLRREATEALNRLEEYEVGGESN